MIVAVPRLPYTLMRGRVQPPIREAWGNAELAIPPEVANVPLVNVFTGEVIPPRNGRPLLCREIFAHFPVALLAST